MEKNNSLLGIGIGIVVLGVILFGLLNLGLFNPATPQYYESYSIGSGEKVSSNAGTQPYYNRPTYHVFNYFDSGALSVMFVFGIIIALAMVDRLYKKTDSLLAAICYIIGTLLLFSSATIFIFGVHDLVTFTGVGETYTKPTMMQQFGWLIESVVFGLLGAGFIWAAELIRKREEEEGSIMHLVIAPVASLLVLFTVPVFMIGVSGVILGSNSRPSFEWLLETIIFGAAAVFLFNKIDQIRFTQGEKTNWREYPLFATAYAFLVPAFFMFITTVMQLVGNELANEGMEKIFLLTLVFGVLGFCAFYLIDRIKKNERYATFPYALIPAGYAFMLIATGCLVGGFSTLIRTNVTANSYRPSFGMIVDVLIFGLLGYISLKYGDEIWSRAKKVKRNMPSAIGLCGILLWVVSLGFFFFAVESITGQHGDSKTVIEFVLYGGLGLGLVIYSDKLRREEGFPKDRSLPRLLSGSGGLLLLVTLLMFVVGLHGWLYSNNPDFAWLGRVIAYGIFGATYFSLGNWLEPVLSKKEKKIKAKILEKSEEKPVKAAKEAKNK